MPGICRGRSRSVAGSVAASFRQGIWIISFFIETWPGRRTPDLDQFLDHPVPRDQSRTLEARITQTAAACARSAASRLTAAASASGQGSVTMPFDAVFDELQRAAGIGRRDHRLARQKRFERDVPVVFVEWTIDHRERTRIQIDQAPVRRAAPTNSMRSDTPSDSASVLGARPAACRLPPSPDVSDDRRATSPEPPDRAA